MNHNQNERYVYTNPIPVLEDMGFVRGIEEYSEKNDDLQFDVFTEQNITALFKTDLQSYSALIFFSNSAHIIQINETLLQNQEKILNYVKEGGGLAVLHQSAITEYDWLPEQIKPKIVPSSHQKADRNSIQFFSLNHPVTKKVQNKTITEKDLVAKKYGHSLFYNVISDYPRHIYSEVIKDQQDSDVLIAGNYHKGRIVITTLILDWHKLAEYIKNIIIWVSSPKIIGLYPAGSPVWFPIEKEAQKKTGLLVESCAKGNLQGLCSEQHTFDYLLIDSDSLSRQELDALKKEMKTVKANESCIINKHQITHNFDVDFSRHLPNLLVQRDKRSIWENSPRKTLEILISLSDSSLVDLQKNRFIESSMSQMLEDKEAILQGDILGVSLYLKFISKIGKSEKIEKIVWKTVVECLETDQLDLVTKLAILHNLSQVKQSQKLWEIMEPLLVELSIDLKEVGKKENVTMFFTPLILSIKLLNAFDVAKYSSGLNLKNDLELKFENILDLFSLREYAQFLDVYSLLLLIELLEEKKIPCQNLYDIALLEFHNLEDQFPNTDLVKYTKFLSFWNSRKSDYSQSMFNYHLSDMVLGSKQQGLDSVNLQNYYDQLEKNVLKLQNTVGVFFKLLNLNQNKDPNKHKTWDYVDSVSDLRFQHLSLRNKLGMIKNVLKANFVDSAKEYFAYLKQITLGLSITSLLFLFSVGLTRSTLLLPSSIFVLILVALLAIDLFLNLESIKQRGLLNVYCFLTSLHLAVALLYVFVLTNFDGLNQIKDVYGQVILTLDPSLLQFTDVGAVITNMFELIQILWRPFILILFSMDIAGSLARRAIRTK